MYLRPNSVFGVFVRRLKTACDGASFSRLSAIYEELVRFTGASLRGVNHPFPVAACGLLAVDTRAHECAQQRNSSAYFSVVLTSELSDWSHELFFIWLVYMYFTRLWWRHATPGPYSAALVPIRHGRY